MLEQKFCMTEQMQICEIDSFQDVGLCLPAVLAGKVPPKDITLPIKIFSAT